VASLDPIARRKFIKQLIDLNMNENKTMLFSTHITSDLERVAADVSLLKDGSITFKGDLSTLKDRIKRIHVQSNSGLPDQLPISNIISQKVNHKSAIVTVDGVKEDDIKHIESKFNAVLTIEQLNLEEIFLELNK
jgi:ABC-2 type transport system ATP-binding protein